MTHSRVLRRVLGLLLAACCSWALSWARAPESHDPWIPPADSAAADSDAYAWRLFVALNWPADADRHAADPGLPLGADRAAVWETWKNTADVFLHDGADPGSWNGAPLTDQRRFEVISPRDFPNLRHIVNGRMVPVTDPLAGAKRLVEVRMNRLSFEYIRAHRLYSVEGQLAAVAGGNRVSFPTGAIHVKAAWRPIEASEASRYHTTAIKLADGTTRLYGLTALNIAAKSRPEWFWASFEHADNQFRADGDGWLHASRDTFACRGRPADCNASPKDIGLEGTVWQYYRLRGTLTAFVDAANRPNLLGNSELEAGLQATASCITCHARASIGEAGGTPARMPIFQAGSVRKGYVGRPDPEWFRGIDADGRRYEVFKPLDFVWSLSQAASERGSSRARTTEVSGDPP
jgi:hypothetical protein